MNTVSPPRAPTPLVIVAVAVATACAACRPAPTPTPTALPMPTAAPSATLRPARTPSATPTRTSTVRPTRSVTPTATLTPVPLIAEATVPAPDLGRIGGGEGPGGWPIIALDGGRAYVVDGRILTAYDVAAPARMRSLGELRVPVPENRYGRLDREWSAIFVRDGRALLLGHEGTVLALDVGDPERMAVVGSPDDVLGMATHRSLGDAVMADGRIFVWFGPGEAEPKNGGIAVVDWRDGAQPRSVDAPALFRCMPDHQLAAAAGRLVFPCAMAGMAYVVVASFDDANRVRIERTLPVPGLTVTMVALDAERAVVVGYEEQPEGENPYRLLDIPLDPPAWPPRRLVRRTIGFGDRAISPQPDYEVAEARNRALRFGTPGPFSNSFSRDYAFPMDARIVDGRLIVFERVSEPHPMAHYPDSVLGLEAFMLSGDGPPRSLGRSVMNLDEPADIAAAGSTLFVPLSGQRLAAFAVGPDGTATQVGAVEGVGPVTSVAPLAGHPGWAVTSGAIVDARDPLHPRQASVVDGGVSVGRLVLSAADDVYVRSTGLVVTDVSDPDAPRPLATVRVPDGAFAVWVAPRDNVALVGFSEYGWRGLPHTGALTTLDLTEPAAPRVLATVSTEALATSVSLEAQIAANGAASKSTPPPPNYPYHVAGAHLDTHVAVVAMGGAVLTFDVADPARPRPVGRLALGAQIAALVPLDDGRSIVQLGIDDDYMEQHFGGDLFLVVLDADRQPRVAGRWALPGARPGAVAVAGSTLLAVTGGGWDDPAGSSLVVVDTDGWRQPVVTRRWPLPYDVRAVAIDAAADRVYLAAGGEGLVVGALSAFVR